MIWENSVAHLKEKLFIIWVPHERILSFQWIKLKLIQPLSQFTIRLLRIGGWELFLSMLKTLIFVFRPVMCLRSYQGSSLFLFRLYTVVEWQNGEVMIQLNVMIGCDQNCGSYGRHKKTIIEKSFKSTSGGTFFTWLWWHASNSTHCFGKSWKSLSWYMCMVVIKSAAQKQDQKKNEKKTRNKSCLTMTL